MSQVQEVFGQFAAQLGTVVMFPTRQEAEAALSAHVNGADQLATAEAYCKANGIEGKNAKGKINVIVSFLQYQDSVANAEPVAEAVSEDVTPTASQF